MQSNKKKEMRGLGVCGDLHDSKQWILNIGGIIVGVTCENFERPIGVDGAKKRFLVDQGVFDTTIEVKLDLPPKESGFSETFDAGVLWQLYKKEEDFFFCFTSPIAGFGLYKTARFGSDFSTGEVCLHRSVFDSGRPVDPLEYPLDELLVVNLLSGGRGIEVHACGVVDPSGNGHLFVGQSGAGKSTVAMLWQRLEGVKILSDDRIILRKHDERIVMYGTPWHGEAGMSCPDAAPLTGVYFLRQARKDTLEAQKRVEAAARMLACSFVPFYSPSGLSYSMSFLEELTKAAPCYDLGFAPRQQVVEFVLGIEH
jgi:hypothetical protein